MVEITKEPTRRKLGYNGIVNTFRLSLAYEFERYIDQGQLLQLQLHSLKSRELRLKNVGVIGK